MVDDVGALTLRATVGVASLWATVGGGGPRAVPAGALVGGASSLSALTAGGPGSWGDEDAVAVAGAAGDAGGGGLGSADVARLAAGGAPRGPPPPALPLIAAEVGALESFALSPRLWALNAGAGATPSSMVSLSGERAGGWTLPRPPPFEPNSAALSASAPPPAAWGGLTAAGGPAAAAGPLPPTATQPTHIFLRCLATTDGAMLWNLTGFPTTAAAETNVHHLLLPAPPTAPCGAATPVPGGLLKPGYLYRVDAAFPSLGARWGFTPSPPLAGALSGGPLSPPPLGALPPPTQTYDPLEEAPLPPPLLARAPLIYARPPPTGGDLAVAPAAGAAYATPFAPATGQWVGEAGAALSLNGPAPRDTARELLLTVPLPSATEFPLRQAYRAGRVC